MKVTDKREVNDISIRRRRECIKCKKRFTTYERIDAIPLIVIKKNGSKEHFDRDKLTRGIVKACEKRPVTVEHINKVVNEIERKLRSYKKIEVTSKAIGDLVIRKLQKLDKVAYVRFASVYKSFRDIKDFEEEVKSLKKEKRNVAK